jgi:hypothetical protein
MTPQASHSPQCIKDEDKSKFPCFFDASYLFFYELSNFFDMFLRIQILALKIT